MCDIAALLTTKYILLSFCMFVQPVKDLQDRLPDFTHQQIDDLLAQLAEVCCISLCCCHQCDG